MWLIFSLKEDPTSSNNSDSLQNNNNNNRKQHQYSHPIGEHHPVYHQRIAPNFVDSPYNKTLWLILSSQHNICNMWYITSVFKGWDKTVSDWSFNIDGNQIDDMISDDCLLLMSSKPFLSMVCILVENNT